MKKRDMWKIESLAKDLAKWAPSSPKVNPAPKVEHGHESPVKAPAVAAIKMPKATAADYQVKKGSFADMKKPSGDVPPSVAAKPSVPKPSAPKPDVVVQKASLGRQEIDWSKPDGAPVDLLDAVGRQERMKETESQGQKKEEAVFSEAQKRHYSGVEKSDIFKGWNPSGPLMQKVEDLKKK